VPGLTVAEICKVLRFSHASVSARVHDAERRNEIRKHGKRETDSGRLAWCWVQGRSERSGHRAASAGGGAVRVLIFGEYSGRVRDAFRSFGHERMSVDLLPSERPSPFHMQGDGFEAIRSNHCGCADRSPALHSPQRVGSAVADRSLCRLAEVGGSALQPHHGRALSAATGMTARPKRAQQRKLSPSWRRS